MCEHFICKPLPNFLPPFFSLMAQGLTCKKGQNENTRITTLHKTNIYTMLKVNNILNSRKEWYCKKHKTKQCVYLRSNQETKIVSIHLIGDIEC